MAGRDNDSEWTFDPEGNNDWTAAIPGYGKSNISSSGNSRSSSSISNGNCYNMNYNSGRSNGSSGSYIGSSSSSSSSSSGNNNSTVTAVTLTGNTAATILSGGNVGTISGRGNPKSFSNMQPTSSCTTIKTDTISKCGSLQAAQDMLREYIETCVSSPTLEAYIRYAVPKKSNHYYYENGQRKYKRDDDQENGQFLVRNIKVQENNLAKPYSVSFLSVPTLVRKQIILEAMRVKVLNPMEVRSEAWRQLRFLQSTSLSSST
jgi:hypothetical protein